MEINQIRSKNDLILFFGERDKNMNQKIEVGEYAEKAIQPLDQNSDRALSPWEVMAAVNTANPVKIFSPEETIKAQDNLVYWMDMSLTLKADCVFYGISFKAGSVLDINQNRINGATLVGTATIKGITYQEMIVPYQNGIISDGILAEDTLVQGILFKGGNSFLFWEDGKIMGGILAEDTHYQGVLLKAGERFCLNQDHTIVEATLAQDTGFQGIKCPAGSIVNLYCNGNLCSITLAKDTMIDKNIFKARTHVYLKTNGKIDCVSFAENTFFQGLTLLANRWVTFHPNGRVREGVLAKDCVIKGIAYKAETELTFDDRGKVIGAR